MSNNMVSSSKFAEYRRNYRQILKPGTPILVGQLGMIVVGFADNAMIGHYSTDALAAASFVNNVFSMALLLCIGFTYGLTPLLGALYSMERNDDIGATLRRGIRESGAAVPAKTGKCYSMLISPSKIAPFVN